MERGLFYKFRTVIYIFLVAVMAGMIFCIYPANTQIREWHTLLKNNIKDIKKYFDYIHIFERVFLKSEKYNNNCHCLQVDVSQLFKIYYIGNVGFRAVIGYCGMRVVI